MENEGISAIQKAFENWAKEKHYYDLSLWSEYWGVGESITGQARRYASITTDCDFYIFKAGWQAFMIAMNSEVSKS
jgi:hypothetical protein